MSNFAVGKKYKRNDHTATCIGFMPIDGEILAIVEYGDGSTAQIGKTNKAEWEEVINNNASQTFDIHNYSGGE